MAKTEPKKRSALGKGFEALLPSNFDTSMLVSNSDKIEKISINRLVPNRYQPRTEFEDEALQQLAASIKSYGVLQPIVVTTDRESGGYMIIAGERRWRASKIAGMETIPAIVRSAEDLERLEIALIENVQRVNLSALEQAASVEYLHTQFGTSYDDIAERLGKGKSTVANIVRLLSLPDDARQALRDGTITEGHARSILALKKAPNGEAKQAELLKNIIKNDWTVRQAEQYVTAAKQDAKAGDDTGKVDSKRLRTETPLTQKLAKRLNTPVFIRRTAKGGKLELAFGSDEQLDAILQILNT